MAEARPLAPAPSLWQIVPNSSFVTVSTSQRTLPDMVGTKKGEAKMGLEGQIPHRLAYENKV